MVWPFTTPSKKEGPPIEQDDSPAPASGSRMVLATPEPSSGARAIPDWSQTPSGKLMMDTTRKLETIKKEKAETRQEVASIVKGIRDQNEKVQIQNQEILGTNATALRMLEAAVAAEETVTDTLVLQYRENLKEGGSFMHQVMNASVDGSPIKNTNLLGVLENSPPSPMAASTQLQNVPLYNKYVLWEVIYSAGGPVCQKVVYSFSNHIANTLLDMAKLSPQKEFDINGKQVVCRKSKFLLNKVGPLTLIVVSGKERMRRNLGDFDALRVIYNSERPGEGPPAVPILEAPCIEDVMQSNNHILIQTSERLFLFAHASESSDKYDNGGFVKLAELTAPIDEGYTRFSFGSPEPNQIAIMGVKEAEIRGDGKSKPKFWRIILDGVDDALSVDEMVSEDGSALPVNPNPFPKVSSKHILDAPSGHSALPSLCDAKLEHSGKAVVRRLIHGKKRNGGGSGKKGRYEAVRYFHRIILMLYESFVVDISHACFFLDVAVGNRPRNSSPN